MLSTAVYALQEALILTLTLWVTWYLHFVEELCDSQNEYQCLHSWWMVEVVFKVTFSDFRAPVFVRNAIAWTIHPMGRVVDNWNILAYASNSLKRTGPNNLIENVLLKIALYNEPMEHKTVILGFRFLPFLFVPCHIYTNTYMTFIQFGEWKLQKIK